MTTSRPISSYSVFPGSSYSTTSSRSKLTRAVRYSRFKARTRSTQIQVWRNAQKMEFWKVVRPVDQATVTTRLYHEVLTEIYKEEGSGDESGTASLASREQLAIEEAYRQLSLPPSSISIHQRRKSMDTQPMWPSRKDSLLPPPPLAYRRQAYHDRPRRDREAADLPLRGWQADSKSIEARAQTPLNFSRPDRKHRDRITPVGSPITPSFPHSMSEPNFHYRSMR